MPVSSSTSGWRRDRNVENRVMPTAPALMVENAHPVARRNCDHAFTGSRNQSWVMPSNRALPRPRGVATPRRAASQWSEA